MPYNPIVGPVFDIYGGQANDGESGWRQAINQSFLKLDATVSLSVINIDQPQDPSSPQAGDRYVVGIGATGSTFTGHGKDIAVYTYNANGTLGWVFYPPINGLKAYETSTQTDYIYSSSTASWEVIPTQAGSFIVPNVGEFSGDYNNSVGGNLAIDQFNMATYGACKYFVYAKYNNSGTYEKQISEILVTHDGTNAYTTEYAKIITDGTFVRFEAEVLGSNVRLIAYPTSTPLTIRVLKFLINI